MRLGPWSKAVFASAAVILLLLALAPHQVRAAQQLGQGSDLSNMSYWVLECDIQATCSQDNAKVYNYSSASMVATNPFAHSNVYEVMGANYKQPNLDWRAYSTMTYSYQVFPFSFGYNPNFGEEVVGGAMFLYDGTRVGSYQPGVWLKTNPFDSSRFGCLFVYTPQYQAQFIGCPGNPTSFATISVVAHIQSKTFDVYYNGQLYGSGFPMLFLSCGGCGTDISTWISFEEQNLYPGQGQATTGYTLFSNWSWTLS